MRPVTQLPGTSPAPSIVERPARVWLRPMARVDVEGAREFLTELGGQVAGADLPRAMYLLGLLEGHALALLDVMDTITELDQ